MTLEEAINSTRFFIDKSPCCVEYLNWQIWVSLGIVKLYSILIVDFNYCDRAHDMLYECNTIHEIHLFLQKHSIPSMHLDFHYN